MYDEDHSAIFELLLIELEYALADLEYERERQATLGQVAKVAQIRSKFASARCAVELGLNLILDFERDGAEIVAK